MKNKLLFLLTLALASVLTLSAQENKNKEQKKKSEEITFAVNMFCENCKAKIEKNIAWEKGVKDLNVNLEKKTVTIIYDPQKATTDKLKKAIEKLGYVCN
ncbi:MAG: cation transporter [Tannerellaceae bacterium]|jgi:copper chaperone CopZ|nr:cation transporter [Tannerellaceae bacterium]